MQVLLLTEHDVRNLLSMDLALAAVEEGLRKLALDEAQNMPRTRVQTDHAMLHVLSASAKTFGALGYKAYTTSRKGTAFHVALYDGATGDLQALMQADYLGQVRTGAASGIATRLMARPEASEVGIFGSGKQARTQVEAVCKVRSINRVQVYSPNVENRRRFAADMSARCRVEVEPVDRPEAAARDKDIVITATKSREPVLIGHWVGEGTHINAVGSNFLGKAELDSLTVRRCKPIVVDSKDQARLEAGDFSQALEEGAIHWSDVRELGQVIVGRFPGRVHPQDVTLFKSLGIGIEDVVVAARIYAKARAEGIGREVEW
jgi:alanine dehydrogenase